MNGQPPPLPRIAGPRDRRGFTLVELAVVVLIINIIVALAMPNIKMALLKARAVDVVADLEVLRVGVLSFQADNHQWPPDAPVGVVPAGLDSYLPEGFDFDKDDYTLNYDNWTTNSPYFIAVTAETSEDPLLGAVVVDLLGSNAWTNGSFKFTWIIEWLD